MTLSEEQVGTQPKFVIGQRVVFVNDYGVNWGEKVLSRYEWNEVRGHTWQYEGTGTPWVYSNEGNFFSLDDIEGIKFARVAGFTNDPPRIVKTLVDSVEWSFGPPHSTAWADTVLQHLLMQEPSTTTVRLIPLLELMGVEMPERKPTLDKWLQIINKGVPA